ncbi:MAG: glycoside hydrolase family 2 protein [Bacteroidales bacterium]
MQHCKLFFIRPLFVVFMVASAASCTYKGNLPVIFELKDHWEFRQADSGSWMPATVPGCVHTDLLAAGKIEDPFYRMNEKDLQWIDKKDWEYRTTFTVEKNLLEKNNLLLDFKGLDTYAKVYLNDQLILTADNMFREWKTNVKGILREGENVLLIHFDSPIRHGLEQLEALGYGLPASNDQAERGGLGNKLVSVFTRKAPYHYGWDWGPRFVTSGIWRPVQLVEWNQARIEDIWIRQKEVDSNRANLIAQFSITADQDGPARIALTNKKNMVMLGVSEIQLRKGLNVVDLPVVVKNPELWWTNGLGKQNITTLEGTLYIRNKPVDVLQVKTGLRSLRLVQTPDGDGMGKSFYFELNGVPVFMKGANYIPNDNFLPRVTPEKYRDVVKRAADANMNMLRVWGGGIYEEDIFYELCDAYGILVWQDFMFACSMYPGDSIFLANVEQEIKENVIRLRNHASIALWCGNNEIETAWKNWGWQRDYNEAQKREIGGNYDLLFHKLIPGIVAQLDPDRPYWPSSPHQGTEQIAAGKQAAELHSGDVHNWAVWHGKQPFESYENYIPRFMSEYGFQSFPEFRTIKSFTAPEDREVESPVLNWHQRSGPGNMLIRTYMDMYYRQPKDFTMFLYLNQIVQAEGVGLGMEAHRRSRPWCMGTLYWQHNDCWPAPSWSGTDYDGRWKALHYFAKRAYANFMISATASGDSMKVYIVSDSLASDPASLNMRLLDFNGRELWKSSLSINIKPNSSEVAFAQPRADFLKGTDPAKCFFAAELQAGERMLASCRYRFVPAKEIDLPVPVIKQEIKSRESGEFLITLQTDVPAFDVYLNSESCDGTFSDNYFTLLPGEIKRILVKPPRNCSGFANNLKVLTLRDTY